MKQKIKGKICAVFCFAGFVFLKKFCYEVIVKQKKKKCSANNYSQIEQVTLHRGLLEGCELLLLILILES